MLTKCKKKLFSALSVVLILSSLTIPVAASWDDIPWAFDLKAYQGNSYTSERYRQTEDKTNMWYVNYVSSTEGKGTIATFWLAESNIFHFHQSISVNEYVGNSFRCEANEDAKKKYVVLACQNNNFNSNVYQATGYWDEETN